MRIYKDWVDKKIAVGLIGYESKREISRALDGWVGHVDTFILGDGKFDVYDAPNDYSEDGWLDYAEKRYKDKVEFIGYQYAGDQVKKRQRYLDLAGKAKCDYLIAVDTDEYIDPKWQKWDMFYKQLLTYSTLTKDRVFYQWVYIPSNKLWPKQGNEFPSNKWLPSAKIHKKPGTMRFCCDRHYIWCHKNTPDEKLYKWQLRPGNRDKTNPYEFRAKNTIDGVRIRMDRTLRTEEEVKKGYDWAILNSHLENSRQFYKIAEVDGVPPPGGFNSWAEFEAKPHTFHPVTGMRIELD